MRSGVNVVLLLAFSTCTLPALTQASASTKPGQATSVSIVELFTSEGCSSCPPADDLLRRVNLERSSDGQLIIGLSEHVTYWNNLGWQDPYSKELFTDRQSSYALRFALEGPYTPQMVLNGRSQFVGSDEGALRQALKADERQKHLQVLLSSAVRQGDGVDLRFSLHAVGAQTVEVYAALTDDLDRSNVLRGENSGRSLQHAAVARSLMRIAARSDEGETVVHVSFPKNFDRSGKTGHHLVLFVQEPHQGAILGAAASAI